MKTQTLTSASSVSTIQLQFPSFGNSNAERSIEITFNFEAGTVAWRNRVFKVNQRLIAVRFPQPLTISIYLSKPFCIGNLFCTAIIQNPKYKIAYL